MTEKRPSWKDILWSPIYDFVDSRWGTRGLRLFAISIGLVVVAVAWWGLSEKRTQMQRDGDGFGLVADLSDAERMDLVGPVKAPEGFPAWKSELDTQFQQYVTDLRENVRSLGAELSRNLIAMAVFLSDIFEKGLRTMVRLSHAR